MYPPAKIQAWLYGDRYTVLSSLPPLTRRFLRSEGATSSDVVSPLSSGSVGGPPNSIREMVLGCVLESALDVQPLPPSLEAFLSDNINLDIMSGKSLFQKS